MRHDYHLNQVLQLMNEIIDERNKVKRKLRTKSISPLSMFKSDKNNVILSDQDMIQIDKM